MLHRDARHIALSQVGSDGQQRIAAGSVLLVGVGGIGCAAATYLASSGIGHLTLADFDTVDVTNLGRQVLYTADDIGQAKVTVARRRLQAINPDTQITAITERLQGERLVAAVAAADIVLDGCDNFATRFEINEASVANGRRLVSGSAIRLEGQLAVFGPDYDVSPCYRCLYAEADETLESCAGNGVLAPVPGMIGTLMATEALKSFAGIATPVGMLQLFDAGNSGFRTLKIEKQAGCPVCAS